MTCYKPKPAKEEIFEKIDEKTGEIYKSKRFRFLSWAEIDEETPFKEGVTMIPCGKCEGCRRPFGAKTNRQSQRLGNKMLFRKPISCQILFFNTYV